LSREIIVRTLTLLGVGAAALIGACTVERKTPSTDTSSATPAASPAPADTAAASGRAPSTDAWTVTPSGIGPIRVGMTVDDLRRVAGDVAVPAGSAAGCAYVRPPLVPPGVSVMIAKGQVTRIDVDSAGVRSDAAVAVGDSVDRVTSAYPGRVTIAPHKYVQGGQYLTVRPSSPQDSTLRIVFEAEGGRVTRFRSGRVPEVEWVERCG
jgi:hypothetical protein